MKTLNKFILAAGISLATGTAFADFSVTVPQNQAHPTPSAGPMTSQDFVTEAVWGGDKEVAMGRLALERSQDPAVRAFAQRMIHDHSRANQKLINIADNEGLNYPATNVFYFSEHPNTEAVSRGEAVPTGPGTPNLENPKGLPAAALMQSQSPWEQETNIDITSYRDLGGLNGAEFDQAYADLMVKDHAEDIRKFEKASASLNDPKLQQFAQQTLPTLREHYRLAQNMKAKVNGPNNTP